MEGFMRTRLMLIAGLVLTLGLAGSATALEVGEKAPDFTLAGTGGKQVKLADMLGKGPIVVYTFIQAFTAT
jgi:peroxiredoxin Q/BCP